MEYRYSDQGQRHRQSPGTMRGWFLVLSFLLCIGCPRTQQGTNSGTRDDKVTQEDRIPTELQKALQAVREEIWLYPSMEFLPSRKKLQQIAESGDGETWRRLMPLDR